MCYTRVHPYTQTGRDREREDYTQRTDVDTDRERERGGTHASRTALNSSAVRNNFCCIRYLAIHASGLSVRVSSPCTTPSPPLAGCGEGWTDADDRTSSPALSRSPMLASPPSRPSSSSLMNARFVIVVNSRCVHVQYRAKQFLVENNDRLSRGTGARRFAHLSNRASPLEL